MQALAKRTWRYLLEPAEYGCHCMSGKKINKDHRIAWSEYEGMIWCYDCQEDMKGFGGIFDGPIPWEATLMILGEYCFHHHNMVDDTIEAPHHEDGKIVYKVDEELTAKMRAGREGK